MDIRKKFLKASFSGAGMAYLFHAINFGGQIFLARLLLPQHFGTIVLALSIIGIVDMLTTLAIPMAYIHAEETENLFDSAMFLSYIYAMGKLIIGLLIAAIVYFVYNKQVSLFVLLIVLSKIFVPITGILTAKLQKDVQFNKEIFLRGIASSFALLIAVIAAFSGLGSTSLLLREILAPLAAFFLILYFSNMKLRLRLNYSWEAIKGLLHYSYTMFFSRGSEIAYARIPLLLVERFYGVTVLGFLSQTMYLTHLMNTLLGTFTQKVAFVFYSKFREQKERKRKGMRYITAGIIIATVPLSLAFFFFPKQILSFLWGEKWIEGADYLKYLAFFTLMFPLVSNLKSYFWGHAENWIVLRACIIGVAAFTIGIIMIKLLGFPFFFVSVIMSLSTLALLSYLWAKYARASG